MTIQNLPLAKEFELFIELLFAPKVHFCSAFLPFYFCFLLFLRYLLTLCHSESFTSGHSEGDKRPKNLAQDKLREESRPFAIAQGDS